MEYTKERILGRQYGEVHRVLKTKKTSWKKRLITKISTHKIAMTVAISAIIFISIDVVLITNFIHILSII